MTVQTTEHVVTHPGDGSTIEFDVPFRFLGAADLEVKLWDAAGDLVATWTLGTDYTITGADSADGGLLMATVAPAADEKLTIERRTDNRQRSNYLEQDGFPKSTIERDLDRRAMVDQEIRGLLSRAVLATPASIPIDLTLPPLPQSAGKALIVNADGTGLAASTDDYEDQAANAAGWAGAAAESAEAAQGAEGAAVQARDDAQAAALAVIDRVDMRFDSVAAMRANAAPLANGLVFTFGYNDRLDGAGSIYSVHPGDTSSDDGGGVIVDAAGRRLRPLPMWGLTPRNFGAKGNGTDSDRAAFDACQAYYESLGGGIIEVPKGDYPVRIVHNGPGIWWRCEPGTILRAEGSGSVFRVNDTVTGAVTLSDAELRGIELDQEGVFNEDGVQSARALHCVEIRGPNVSIVRCRAVGARYDCLYGAVVGWANFRSISSHWGDCGRNAVSLVEGSGWFFNGGSTWNEGKYRGSGHDWHSLYLFDIEPTSSSTGVTHVFIDEMDFLCGSPVGGAHQLIIGGPYSADGFSHVHVTRSHFGKLTPSSPNFASIRINSDVSSGPIKGVRVVGNTFDGRMFANAAMAYLEHSRVADNTMGAAPFFNVGLGDETFYENNRMADGTPVGSIPRQAGARVALRNVPGHVDILPRISSPFIITDGAARVERHVKAVSLGTSYTQLLTIGTRGSYEIKICGSESSAGAYGLSQVTMRASVSNDTIVHAAQVFDLNASDINVRWVDATDGAQSVNRRTLEAVALNAAADMWVVEVLIRSRFTNSTLTWLV